MGWNDWYEDRCAVTEDDIVASAHQLVSTGLARDGYNTVVIDDCWMAKDRTPGGALAADPDTFPDGIAYISRIVHGLGLKLGIYASAGTSTCGGRAGSYGHYSQDARQFASWGADFVKLDYCNVPAGSDPSALFSQFGAALARADPGIIYSQELPVFASATPTSSVFASLVSASAGISNMWRVAPDEKPADSPGASITGHLQADLPLYPYASPGHWNDLDMLVAGSRTFRYSLAQQEAQADVWAMESSPLIASGDLTSPAALTVLGNKKIVSIDQLGVQGKLTQMQGSVDVVGKPGSVLLVNTSPSPARVHLKARSPLTNVWGDGSPAATTGGYLNRTLPGYGALLFTTSAG
jgi:hypothetical protein